MPIKRILKRLFAYLSIFILVTFVVIGCTETDEETTTPMPEIAVTEAPLVQTTQVPLEELPEESTEEPMDEPTEEPMDEPTEEATEAPEEMVTPAVSVMDQAIEGTTVTVSEVVSEVPGWLVIHIEEEGAPGLVIGYTAVSPGVNTDVSVEIDNEAATDTLYAMLHRDEGEEGEYEFPDSDPPVQVDGEVVVQPFNLTGEAATDGMDDTDDAESDEATVSIVDFAFEPVEITVPVGTTVIWTQDGDQRHTVTADDETFESGTLSSRGSFEYTFTEPGTYPYYCAFHGGPGGEGMSGVVTVTPE